MAFRFAGTNPALRCSPGAFLGFDIQDDPQSYAALIKRNGTGTWDGILTMDNGSTGVISDMLEINPSNELAFWNGGGASSESNVAITNTTDWIIAWMIWTGTSLTFRWKIGANAWQSATFTVSSSDSEIVVSTYRFLFGNDPTLGDDAVMDICCVGALRDVAVSQATAESLSMTDFSTWEAVFTGVDAALWGFETIGSVVDRTGNGANEVGTRNGVTLVADPPGWSWGGGGAVNVDAQLVTTGRGQTTSSYQKGVSRALATSAQGQTPMAHSKGVIRSMTTTGNGLTILTHSKGISRTTITAGIGVTSSTYRKGVSRSSSHTGVGATTSSYQMGVQRQLGTTGIGITDFEVAGIVFNVNRTLTATGNGVTALAHEKGVLRAFVIEGRASASTVYQRGVLRSLGTMGVGQTQVVRVKGSLSSFLGIGEGDMAFGHRKGVSRSLETFGIGYTTFTVPPRFHRVYAPQDGYGHPAFGRAGGPSRGRPGSAARGSAGRSILIGEDTT